MPRIKHMAAVLLCFLSGLIIVEYRAGTSPQETKATAARGPAETLPALAAAANKEKWSVGHQLVQGLPWGSEKRSEQELLNNVKEEERTGDQRLVMALSDLAAWYRSQRRFQEAETTYKRVLKVQEGRMGANHYDTALSHNDLGVVYTESGKYPEAEQSFKRALELWDKSWDMALKTEDNAVTFHNYSVLLDKLGRSAEAKDMEAKADDIMKKREDAIRGK